MLRKEFEERTGIKVDAETYNVIETIYMAVGDDIDKDTFCREYKKFTPAALMLMQRMGATIKRIVAGYDRVQAEAAALREENDRNSRTAAIALLRASRTNCDAELRDEAVKLVGEREVVKLCLEHDIELWDEDIDYIKSNLK